MNNRQTTFRCRLRAIPGLAASIFVVFVLVQFAAIASAGDTQSSDTSTNAITITSGCEMDYPPFCIVNSSGEAGGFSVELLRAALKSMGREVSFQTGPWDKVKQSLVDGHIQVLPLVGRTPERETQFDFTVPYLIMHGAIVVRSDATGINVLSDLKGRKVAVMKNDNAEEFLRRKDRGMDIHTTATFTEALRELSTGICEAVVIQRLVAIRLVQETGFKNLRIVERPVEGFNQEFCFAVRDGDRETLALLNEGLATTIADGTYRHLHSKWFASLELPPGNRIVVGGDRNYPPYEFLDKKGRPAGYNVELTRAIAAAMGFDVEIRLDYWPKIREGLEREDIDAVQGMFYSPERNLTFDFTAPHTANDCVSAVRKGSEPPPSTLAELTGKRIVVQRGDIMHDFVLKNNLTNRLSVTDTMDDALREVVEGRHDCALVARLTALYWIKEKGWSNLVLGRKALIPPEYCYAVPKNNKALLAQFSEGLKVIEANGEYRRISTKWLGVYEGPSPSTQTILKYVAVVVFPLLLILIASFIWVRTLKSQVANQTADLSKAIVERERANAHIRRFLDESETGRCRLLSILEDTMHAENAAKLSSQRLATILAAVPDIIMEVDCNMVYTWANVAGLDFFGEAVLGKKANFYFDGEQDTYRAVKPLFDGDDKVIYVESWQRRWDGEKRLLAWSCRGFKNEHGVVAGALSAAHDITEHKRTEDALRVSEEFKEAIFNSVSSHIAVLDRDGTIVAVNTPWKRFAVDNPKTDGEPALNTGIGVNYLDVCRQSRGESADGAMAAHDGIRDVLEGRATHFSIEYACHSPETNRWFSMDVTPLDKQRHYVVVAHSSITKRKQAETHLMESKALTETIVENIPLMLFLKEATDLRFVVFNRAGEELLGYDRKALLGKNNLDLFPPEQAAHFMAKDREVLDGKTGSMDIPEEPIMTAKKGQRLLHTRKICIRGSDGTTKYLLGISEDITETKRTEQKIQSQLEELRRWHDVMLGREDRVQELKTEVNELCRRIGETVRYSSQDTSPAASATGSGVALEEIA